MRVPRLSGRLIKRDFRTHVTVPRGRLPKHRGILVHPRKPMPDARFVDGIRVTSPLETLIDLATARPEAEMRRLVDEAARRRLIDLDDAAERLQGMRRRAGAKELLALIEAADETDSDLEDVFLELIRDSDIPEPQTQQKLLGFRVDFFWPDIRLVVETDGLTYHRTRAQQAADRIRDQRLTAAGYTCLRFTDNQVRNKPATVLTTLRRVMRRLSKT